LESLATELRGAHGVEVVCVPLDLTRADALATLDAAIGDRHVSVLLNNAGFGLAQPFHESDPERLRAMVELNCVVPTVLARRYLPAMIERRCGAHILLASVAAFQPVGHFAVYAATKSYNLMLGEALWSEHRLLGVETLVLAPGLTATEFQQVSGTQSVMGRMAPEPVVEGALEALGRTPTYVPGLVNKVAAQLPRLGPRRLVAKLAEATGRRMLGAEALRRWKEAIARRG